MESHNRVKKFLVWIKTNKITSSIIILGIIVIAIGNFTNALVSIENFLFTRGSKPLSPITEIIPIRTTETPEDEMPNAVRATGIGFPPLNMSDPIKKRLAAKYAAEADAKNKIAGFIKGEIVKSSSKTAIGVFSDQTIEIIVNTSLKSARIISEKDIDNGGIEVIIEAPIKQE